MESTKRRGVSSKYVNFLHNLFNPDINTFPSWFSKTLYIYCAQEAGTIMKIFSLRLSQNFHNKVRAKMKKIRATFKKGCRKKAICAFYVLCFFFLHYV
jgi:hypothetical protein